MRPALLAAATCFLLVAPASGAGAIPDDVGSIVAWVCVRDCGSGGGPGAPACGDGVDNDSDGFVDYPSDPGCSSASDTSESNSSACPGGAEGWTRGTMWTTGSGWGTGVGLDWNYYYNGCVSYDLGGGGMCGAGGGWTTTSCRIFEPEDLGSAEDGVAIEATFTCTQTAYCGGKADHLLGFQVRWSPAGHVACLVRSTAVGATHDPTCEWGNA